MTVLTFVILGLLLSRMRIEEKLEARNLAITIFTATVVGCLIMTIFFLVHG